MTARDDSNPVVTESHLTQNEMERSITLLEYSLFRTMSALDRWNAECLRANSDMPGNSLDHFVLNVVRLRDTSKTMTEVARFLNRDDLANLQYSLRKLQKAGLIEQKRGGGGRRGVAHRVTKKGREATDQFANMRKRLLMEMLPAFGTFKTQLATAERVLSMMQGIYDQATGGVMFGLSETD